MAFSTLQGSFAEEPGPRRFTPRLFQPAAAQPLNTQELPPPVDPGLPEETRQEDENKPWLGRRFVNAVRSRLSSDEKESANQEETVGTTVSQTEEVSRIPEEDHGAPPAEGDLPVPNLHLPSPEVLQAPPAAREILPWEQATRSGTTTDPFTGVTLPAPTSEVAQNQDEPEVPPLPEAPADQSTLPELKKITSISPFTSYFPPGDNPDVRDIVPPTPNPLSTDPYVARVMPYKGYCWVASNLWHNPLYFEDVALERYGHHYPLCVQPFASVGLFSAQLVGLPYQMTLDQVCARKYALGYYRPGDCAPKLHYQVPLNGHAALVEAGVITGFVFLIP